MMDWWQIGTLVGSNVAMFVSAIGVIAWFRAESRADWRHMDAKMDQHKSETNSIIREMKIETNTILREMKDEMKEFHGRLCAIEERRRNKGE